MKKDIAFIAMGQCGGNIGLLLEKRGYNVLHVNTSSEDLATLREAKHTYHIKDGEGCGKDRDKAKELILNDFAAILEQINQKLKEKYIYVIFSSGGGSGSGGSPLLIDLLIQQTDKKVGAITVLPSSTESPKTAINAYECFAELEGIDGIGNTFALDNNKDDKFLINKNFVDLFDSLMDIPQHQSIEGNIDAEELKIMLSTKGATIISKTTKATSTTAKTIRSFKENIFAPPETDRVIKYIGLSASTPINTDEIMRETGECLDVFRGINTENTICIFCGLTLPYAALEKIKEKIIENQELVSRSLNATTETRLSGGLDFLPQIKQPQPQNKDSVDEVLAKYMRKKS